MWTGRETLGSIESAIGELRRDETQLDKAMHSAVGEAERLRKARAESLRELAHIKLNEMAAGRLVSNLDAGERHAVQLLDEYRKRMAYITERREALLKETADVRATRDAAAKEVEEKLAAVEAIRADVEGRVQNEPEWKQAKAASDSAGQIAAEAEKKAASSEAELGAKKKPYDDDPLFIYLWQRGFGTSRYEASNFTRLMDRMVADFISFGNVRPNYAALIEIPLRLREHATAQRAVAAERLSALSNIERHALVEAGIESMEEALAEVRERLAAADTDLETRLGELTQIDAERNALLAGGANPTYEKALSAIAAADAKDQIAQLYLEAKRTPALDDDAVVKRLEAIDAKVAKADAEVADLRKTANDLAKRRLEIEQVRDRFRGAGYDHPYGTFGNDPDIADALGRTMAGTIGGQILWEILRGGYATRGPTGHPDFGYPSSPFPFPIPGGGDEGSRGGEWRDPGSHGGWFPHGGGRGGGGFGGGGDFSTGGSFLMSPERDDHQQGKRRTYVGSSVSKDPPN